MEFKSKYDYQDEVIHKEDRQIHKIWHIEIKTSINWAGHIEYEVFYNIDLSRRWWKEEDLYKEGEI